MFRDTEAAARLCEAAPVSQKALESFDKRAISTN